MSEIHSISLNVKPKIDISIFPTPAIDEFFIFRDFIPELGA
jgi:hypothetical protein